MFAKSRGHSVARYFTRSFAVQADQKLGHSEWRKNTSWQIHSYGGLDELQFNPNLRIPVIKHPNEVLIKVNASSVNPIDVAMIGGYGSKLLNLMRINDIEFPLSMGRDFSGTIAHKGISVPQKFELNDTVFGVIPVHKQGCHSRYVLVDANNITSQPATVSNVEASAILYAGLTAWSGLFISGLLSGVKGQLCSSIGGGKGKRVLVLGASGGVGTSALQILRAEESIITATCASDAINLVQSLGAHQTLDYTSPDYLSNIQQSGPFDIVLDCAGKGSSYAAEIPTQFETYVTFNSPLLQNTDLSGVSVGMIKNAFELIQTNMTSVIGQNGCVKWGFFLPAPQGIQYLKTLVENSMFKPIVHSIHKFENLPEAYQAVQNGHLRGKVVIEH